MREEMSEEMRVKSFQDFLFKHTMKNEWKKVMEIYMKHPSAHKTKLTKSEETAFHIAISSYHHKNPSHATYIEQMIRVMHDKGSLRDVLSMQNVKGDTPLHLAAAVGLPAVCECMASKDRELIRIRNVNGETPLFVAAHNGELQAFLCLHQLCNPKKDQRPDESLGRREDGNTILHSAISGEHFSLAYQIISYYPMLINSVNVDGEFPLHILARKPHVFKSSNQLGFYDSIIYHCIFVDELKKQKYDRSAIQTGCYPESGNKFPDNYRTCVNIFLFLWTPIHKSFLAGFPRCKKRNGAPIDEGYQQPTERKLQIDDEEGNSNDGGTFPANYTTCISLLKFATKVVLIFLGVGFWRIKKIQEKKVRNSHALQIMNKMIEFESNHSCDSNGQRPVQKLESQCLGRTDIPDTPPHDDEHDVDQSTQTSIGTTSSTKAEEKNEHLNGQDNSGEMALNNIVMKDTPLLVAAKMGIPEMVKKIISTCPVAIQDQDSDGKNVLMLAVENRQISVFDYLLQTNLPEYMFHQVDNGGNSILHLAAKLGELQPWRIPGAALQMQWEIKWCKHVRRSVPALSFSHYNADGETPRKIFARTHKDLMNAGNEWLIKTSESCSVVAALIATVAFATSATVPGGLSQESGRPILEDHKAFDIFSVTSLVALCLSVTALVFFLAIITSRFEERDFKRNLPRKLLMGLTCLFSSIAAMLLSFCAGHTFILREKLRVAAVPIYAVATIPVTFFAMAQLPLYFDLLRAACKKVPLRSYKVFH